MDNFSPIWGISSRSNEYSSLQIGQVTGKPPSLNVDSVETVPSSKDSTMSSDFDYVESLISLITFKSFSESHNSTSLLMAN